MFERFTESARRALFFARYEASEFGSMSIETEHMLMGLIREASGVVASLLTPEVTAAMKNDVRRRVAAREKVATSVEIPFSEETKRVLQYAADEADGLKHAYIGSEHLLLGLLREDGTIAGSILKDQGFRLPQVRADLMRLLSEPSAVEDVVRDDVKQRIEQIKMMVELLGDYGPGIADRQFHVRQISAALDDLLKMWA
jgi:ATP-dependent Clp protease ATP-binding subunit ClpC